MSVFIEKESLMTKRANTGKDFGDYETFAARVGLITEPERLRAIGAPELFTEETGMFETEALAALQEFCRLNQQFHIATLTSDSDEVERVLYEDLWQAFGDGRWSEQPDDVTTSFREKWQAGALTIDNKIRLVNRLNFYLCDGDADAELTLTEIW